MQKPKLSLIIQHRLWIKNQWKRRHDIPTQDGAIFEDGELGCGNCGCFGNRDCGHFCLDTDNNCTLLGDDTCPCCTIEPMPLTDREYDKTTGQRRMLDEADNARS